MSQLIRHQNTAGLDGLRGTAILLVMFYHCGVYYQDKFHGFIIGVEIFFVLSGFLISGLIIKEFYKHGYFDFKIFYTKRILRIYPALLFFISVLFVSNFIHENQNNLHQTLEQVSIAIFNASNFAIMTEFNSMYYLQNTWSLSIEWQYYLIWPILLVFLLRVFKNKYVIAFIVLCVILYFLWFRLNALSLGQFPWLYYSPQSRIIGLLIGSLVAIIIQPFHQTDNLRKIDSWFFHCVIYCAYLSLAWIIPTIVWNEAQTYYWGFLAIDIITSLIIIDIYVSKYSLSRNFLEMRWLCWIGSISYALYLWHYACMLYIGQFNLSAAQIILIGTAVAFLGATFSFYIIERPTLSLKKNMTYNLVES